MSARRFAWLPWSYLGHVGYHLVCVSDPGPCPENPRGRQIVAEVTFERQPHGRQAHRYRVRVWWDSGDDGRGHYEFKGADHLPRGADPGQRFPTSWALVGNTTAAKRWAEGWLARWLWQWDACEVVDAPPALPTPAPASAVVIPFPSKRPAAQLALFALGLVVLVLGTGTAHAYGNHNNDGYGGSHHAERAQHYDNGRRWDRGGDR